MGLLAWAEGRDGIAPADVYVEAVQTFVISGGNAAALGVVATTQGCNGYHCHPLGHDLA